MVCNQPGSQQPSQDLALMGSPEGPDHSHHDQDGDHHHDQDDDHHRNGQDYSSDGW